MHINNVKKKIAANTSEWSEIERRFWNERKTKRRFNYPPWPSHGTPPPHTTKTNVFLCAINYFYSHCGGEFTCADAV